MKKRKPRKPDSFITREWGQIEITFVDPKEPGNETITPIKIAMHTDCNPWFSIKEARRIAKKLNEMADYLESLK